MGKIYNIDDLISKSNEVLRAKMQKLNINKEQLDVLYAVASAGCMFKIEDGSLKYDVVRSVKVGAIKNILTVFNIENDFDDIEDILISKFRNESYINSKKYDGAKFVYACAELIDTEELVASTSVIFTILIDVHNEFVCAYQFNDDIVYFRREQKQIEQLKDYTDFIDKLKEICNVEQ